MEKPTIGALIARQQAGRDGAVDAAAHGDGGRDRRAHLALLQVKRLTLAGGPKGVKMRSAAAHRGPAHDRGKALEEQSNLVGGGAPPHADAHRSTRLLLVVSHVQQDVRRLDRPRRAGRPGR